MLVRWIVIITEHSWNRRIKNLQVSDTRQELFSKSCKQDRVKSHMHSDVRILPCFISHVPEHTGNCFSVCIFSAVLTANGRCSPINTDTSSATASWISSNWSTKALTVSHTVTATEVRNTRFIIWYWVHLSKYQQICYLSCTDALYFDETMSSEFLPSTGSFFGRTRLSLWQTVTVIKELWYFTTGSFLFSPAWYNWILNLLILLCVVLAFTLKMSFQCKFCRTELPCFGLAQLYSVCSFWEIILEYKRKSYNISTELHVSSFNLCQHELTKEIKPSLLLKWLIKLH